MPFSALYLSSPGLNQVLDMRRLVSGSISLATYCWSIILFAFSSYFLYFLGECQRRLFWFVFVLIISKSQHKLILLQCHWVYQDLICLFCRLLQPFLLAVGLLGYLFCRSSFGSISLNSAINGLLPWVTVPYISVSLESVSNRVPYK